MQSQKRGRARSVPDAARGSTAAAQAAWRDALARLEALG
jgi:hypothetical protein